MRRGLAKLRARWHGEKAEIARGIGIHTCDAIVGNIGSELRMEHTAIGKTVNLASRLEATTKEQGCEILLSESTAAKIGPPSRCAASVISSVVVCPSRWRSTQWRLPRC